MNREGLSVEELTANERFQNYCRNTNIEDVAYWQQYIKDHPEQLATIQEAKHLVLVLALELSDEEISIEFKEFKQTLRQREKGQGTKLRSIQTKSIATKSNKVKYGVLVASFLLLVSVFIWEMAIFTPPQNYELSTNYGVVRTHILPDGSKVILNANSKITYTDWGLNKSRIVYLTGEAFFEVQSTIDQQKFSVQTARGTIEVLGTSFNVLQRQDQLAVALLEGAVAIKVPHYPTIRMVPGELVSIEGANYKRQEADVDAYSAWRYQRMVFKETPIYKVIQRLSDEFNWAVTVENEQILRRKISASIPKNDPTLLLEALSEIYDLKIEQITEGEYIIR